MPDKQLITQMQVECREPPKRSGKKRKVSGQKCQVKAYSFGGPAWGCDLLQARGELGEGKKSLGSANGRLTIKHNNNLL